MSGVFLERVRVDSKPDIDQLTRIVHAVQTFFNALSPIIYTIDEHVLAVSAEGHRACYLDFSLISFIQLFSRQSEKS